MGPRAVYEVYGFNNNDNDKRLWLTAKADQPDHKKYSTLKIKVDNEAVQKLHTSQLSQVKTCLQEEVQGVESMKCGGKCWMQNLFVEYLL